LKFIRDPSKVILPNTKMEEQMDIVAKTQTKTEFGSVGGEAGVVLRNGCI
jgi:hypothetical protein